MTSLCALVSGFGWHVADLERAAKEIGVSFQAIEFPRVSASVGMTQGSVARELICKRPRDGSRASTPLALTSWPQAVCSCG